MTETKPRVIRGRIELIAPHEDGELAFVYPPKGPNFYQAVGKKLLERKLNLPTGYQTASLIHGAYASEEPEFQEIQKILRDNWLWVFSRNLWTSEGVYVVHDPEAIGVSQPLYQDDLERRLAGREEIGRVRFSEDRTISFAPKDSYQLGEHTPESLAKDGFMIASFEKEGAEKLGEDSGKFKENPCIWGLDIGERQEPVQRVSALNSGWGAGRLVVDGDVRGDGRYGYAFGV